MARACLVGGMVVMLAAAGRARTAMPPADYPAAVQAYGATSLYDALLLALQMRPETTEARSVALVFSDGRDTASWLSKASVAEAIRRSGVVTHVAGAGWHDVKVTLKGARGDVIARPGYFVAAK